MPEIDSFRGSVEELTDFVNMVWRSSYAGRMTFPIWSEEFFRWQLRMDDEGSGRNLIAAYDNNVLVGVLLGTNYPFRSPIGFHIGSQWSWLSVHPEYRKMGIAKALHRERLLRQEASGSGLVVSYRYVGSSHSQAEQLRGESDGRKVQAKLGFWARVLDPVRFRTWHWSRIEGLIAKATAPLAEIPRLSDSDNSVRRFRIEDLDAGLQLIRESHTHCDVAIHWDEGSLRHQLSGSPVSHSLVLEEHGRVTGLVNFHVLSLQAKTIEKVGVLDLIVFGKTSISGKLRLVNAALKCMKEQDVILALKVRCGDTPVWPLLRARFVPQFPESLLVFQSIGDPIEVPAGAAMHLLWR